MKKITLLIAGAILMFAQACAQTTNVPTAVQTSFQQKFPEAKKVKWDKENETEWEAEFKLNGEEYSANFTNDGVWKETEHEIKKSAIPAAVQQTLDNEFSGYKIEEVEISETADGRVYEFALEKAESEMEVTISLEGKVVKKEVKEQEDDKENK